MGKYSKFDSFILKGYRYKVYLKHHGRHDFIKYPLGLRNFWERVTRAEFFKLKYSK